MASNYEEHREMFDSLLRGVDCGGPYTVLDAGSGMTSLSLLTEKFPNSVIDAVCYPGDHRKLDSIKANVKEHNYNLMEVDICRHSGWAPYDFVVAHLLLGEAAKFGNDFACLLRSLLGIRGRHLLIVDYPEDPGVDFGQIVRECCAAGYKLASEHIVRKSEPQFNSLGELIGTYYKGMLFYL